MAAGTFTLFTSAGILPIVRHSRWPLWYHSGFPERLTPLGTRPAVTPADPPTGPPMQITLYKRTYPVDGAPVSLSVTPFAASQRHTFPVGGRVYEAAYSEVRVAAPDDATVDVVRNRLTWGGGKNLVRSTAQEVFDLALARNSGFRVAK